MRLSAKSIFSLNLFVFLIGLCLFKQNHTSALSCSHELIAFKTRHTVLRQPSLLSSAGLISLGMKSVTRTKKKKKKAYKVAFGLGCQAHSWDLHNAVRVLKMKGRVDCAICLQVLASRWWVDTAAGGALERWCLRQPQTFLPTSSLSVGRGFTHFSLTWHRAFHPSCSSRWSEAVNAADSAFPWTLSISGWVSGSQAPLAEGSTGTANVCCPCATVQREGSSYFLSTPPWLSKEG